MAGNRTPSTPAPQEQPTGAVAALLALRFLTELFLLVALAVVGVHFGRGHGVGTIAFGVAALAFGVVVWGFLVAPKARLRLPDPARLAVELVMFAGAATLLIVAGDWVMGVPFAVISIGVAFLVRKYAPNGAVPSR
jgi:hypothetical protein